MCFKTKVHEGRSPTTRVQGCVELCLWFRGGGIIGPSLLNPKPSQQPTQTEWTIVVMAR